MSKVSRRRFMAGAGAMAGTAAVLPGVLGGSRAVAAGSGDAGRLSLGTGLVTVGRGEARYGDLVTGFNQRWVGRPEAVRLPTTTEHVVQAVQEAVDGKKTLTVRGGGHGFEDFVFRPDVEVVLDMTLMDATYYDPGMRAFAVESGATLLDVYETLYEGWGVFIPGGVCFAVGIGGHASGGGYGMLSRKHGLVVDHLYAVEVVTVDASGRAKAVVATREENDPHRDLWWGYAGGGGGNFGVITRYWFRSHDATGSDPARLLPSPPNEVLVTAAAWPWERVTQRGFADFVKFYGEWHEKNSRSDSPYAGMCSWLFLNHKSSGSLGLLLQMDGTVANAERLVDDFLHGLNRALGVEHQELGEQVGELRAMPEFASTRRLPWLKATRYIGTSSELQTNPTFRGEHKSAYMKKGFPDSQIAAIYKHLTRDDYANKYGGLVATSFGGRINDVAPDATPVAQRSSVLKLLYQTYWTDPADDARNQAWLREFYREVYAETGGVPVPNAVTDGCYINYADSDIGDARFNTSDVPWYRLYYKDNYARLQRVKATYDPGNFFRHRQSVRLPS
ncbi:FAD-binding oxidoreductase [Streptomyces gamaensis]|uniref:FAD-binding oxidoreductase n=1 Tax=Streptomyces gamaensis TaxID=1763542 RepID=A0ABW0YXI7_9ACTN